MLRRGELLISVWDMRTDRHRVFAPTTSRKRFRISFALAASEICAAGGVLTTGNDCSAAYPKASGDATKIRNKKNTMINRIETS